MNPAFTHRLAMVAIERQYREFETMALTRYERPLDPRVTIRWVSCDHAGECGSQTYLHYDSLGVVGDDAAFTVTLRDGRVTLSGDTVAAELALVALRENLEFTPALCG